MPAPVTPAVVRPTPPGPPLPDPGRRAFFRSFGRQAFNAAAQVVGVTNAVSKATTNVAAGVVGLAVNPEATADRLGAAGAGVRSATLPASGTGGGGTPATEAPRYRSAFRLMGDQLFLLDQRGLPDRLDEQLCRRASDVAFYMRVMAVRGGPLMAQLAAYGLALTAREIASRSFHARRAEWKRVCRALLAARPGSRMVRVAIERMTALHDTFGPDVDASHVADELRREADSLAMESQLDHATIARTLAAQLPRPEGRPLHLLVHGAPGTSTGGHIGTGLNAIALVAQESVPVKVWITETRPYLEGARLATWELAPTGVELTVLPDSAVAHLLDHETIDAVIMGAEWIAADGATSNVVGSRMVAEMAALARPGPVPVWIAAPATTIDPGMPDGGSLPLELRPGREIVQHLSGWKPERPNAYLPAHDVIPPSRITAIVTEEGVVAPQPEALAAALARRAARRPAIAPPWEPPSPERVLDVGGSGADGTGTSSGPGAADGGGATGGPEAPG